MSSAFDKMTQREKVIMSITVVLALGALLYLGYLKHYVAEYRLTVSLIKERELERETQRVTLRGQERIEERFAEIRNSVARRQGRKSPQAVFIEDIYDVIKSSNISPYRFEPVAGAPDYAYILVSIDGLRATYGEVADVLKEFKRRQLIIRKLRIQQYPPAISDPELSLSADLAQLVRVSDLDVSDQAIIRQAQQAMSKN